MSKKLCLLLLILCLIPAACPAYAADYSITDYTMDVTLLSDGSAAITETLIYDFDGEYNGVVSLFDTDGVDGLTGFRALIDGVEMRPVDSMKYEDNTYVVTETGPISEVRVYSPGNSDTRTVVYEYTLQGLARRYEDAGMILRKFIGENNSVSLHDAIITVHFPGNGGIRAFAHGGMKNEHITLFENAVVFGPQTVYSGDSVEVRLLFPAEWIDGTPLQEGSILKTALDEEQRLMDEAERAARTLKISKYLLSAAYVVLFSLLIALMMKKYGLRGRNQTEDLQHLTAWPAAFAQTAVSGAPDTDALSGTLIELARMGCVRMEENGRDVRFTLTERNHPDLYPHQNSLIGWLFAHSDVMDLSTLNAGSDYGRAQSFEKGYAAYCSQVVEDMNAASLRFSNEGLRIALNAALILTGIAAAAFILLAGEAEVLLGCAMVLITFLSIFLTGKIRTLTDEGERLQSAANHLMTNEIVQDDRLLTLLPYYTALGMTEPLVAAFTERPVDFHAPFLYGGWYHSLHHLSSGMRETHYHNASIPDPDASSSSSGSSGGGSNGGGGGHGAW